jgi:hypothetical protein
VSRKNPRGGRQGENPLQASFKSRRIRVRSVGAPDSVAEKCVAGNKDGGSRVIKAHRTTRVPRTVNHAEVAARDRVAVRKQDVGRRYRPPICLEVTACADGLEKSPIGILAFGAKIILVQHMDGKWHRMPTGLQGKQQFGNGRGMVEVAVSDDNQGGDKATGVEERKYPLALGARIHKDAGGVFQENVGVFAKGSYREPFQHGRLNVISQAGRQQAVLVPVYAAFAAALLFYFLIPIAGAFRLRSQWRRFRERITRISLAPILQYGDISSSSREDRAIIGRFRLLGTIDAIEGQNRVWVRGKNVSALVDLSKAPLYVAAPGPAEPGSIERLRWSSVSSLVEGTSIFVGGLLKFKDGRPIFIEAPDEVLIAVCHDETEDKLVPKLIAGGRASNEYWNYLTIISLAMGVAVISGILLIFRTSVFSTLAALIFLAGAIPILPFAPPGLALFFMYFRFWRLALAARTSRDLLKLPPQPSGDNDDAPEGDPEILTRHVERQAFVYAAAAGLSFGLALIVNFILAFIIWRSVL